MIITRMILFPSPERYSRPAAANRLELVEQGLNPRHVTLDGIARGDNPPLGDAALAPRRIVHETSHPGRDGHAVAVIDRHYGVLVELLDARDIGEHHGTAEREGL